MQLSLLLTLPEILLSVAAMALMLIAAFEGDKSARTATWLAVLALILAAVLVPTNRGGAGFNGLFIADDFAELGRIVVTNRCVKRSRPDRDGLQLGNFPARNADFVAELVIGGFAAELFAHLQRNATHLGDFVHEVHRQPDGFTLVRQCSLDGLLDPPCGVSAQLSALCRVKPLHRLHEPDVAFGD